MFLLLCLVASVNCDHPTSPTVCPTGVSLNASTLTSAGGSGSVTVTAPGTCGWTATSEASWITGLTPASGQGDGEVQFQVGTNPGATSRQGSVRFNSVRVSVVQPGGCAVSLSPTKQDVAAESSTGTVTVTAAPDCAWSAASTTSWLSVTSGASVIGNGIVGFSVATNSGAQRSGTLTIGDQSFVVTQADVNAPNCQFVLQPSAASVGIGGGQVPVNISGDSRCSWKASTTASWIGFDVDSGNGSTTVIVTVAPNGTGSNRSGIATIGGVTFTVTQAG